MRKCHRSARVASVLCLGVAWASVPATPAHADITFGQLDDFQDGTTMGWVEGSSSPNPPGNVATGGEAGAGDRYLRNVSTGGFGAGSRQVMFNEAQWTGNYNAAGVTRIDANLANFGSAPLHMRVTVADGSGGRYSSTNAVILPADGVWRPVTFDLTPSAMTQVGGASNLSTVLSNVDELRLLSAAGGPTYSAADAISSALGVDDLRALRLPGDATFDGTVNLADFGRLRQNFGTASGATFQQGDFNFDGRVNLADFGLLRANFGSTIQSTAPAGVDSADLAVLADFERSLVVPEPTVLPLLALAGLGLTRRRRPGVR